jgi:predicted phosphoribosyltransferase
MFFLDRHDAGRKLAQSLLRLQGENPVVLGLPRGGVPVAYEVALVLHAPLDVFIVRKLGVPGREELAMGAIASGGVRVLNHEVIAAYHIPQAIIEQVTRQEMETLERYERDYRGDLPPPEVRGRTVILIDDGLATGSTMRAAVAAMRHLEPDRLVVAVPVAAASTCEELRDQVDEVVCLMTPEPFFAVGSWYRDFSQTSDAEVRSLLRLAER